MNLGEEGVVLKVWPKKLAFVAGSGLLLLSLIGEARSAPPPTLISACSTINAAGFYVVSSDITTSGDCITIVASNVVLGLHANITGDGSTGTGILIAKGAANTIIRGAYAQFVSGFDIGVEDDEGGSVIGDFAVNENATSGLLLNGSTPTMVDDIEADNNGHDGIHVKTSGNRLNFSLTDSNGTFGLWLDLAANSLVSNLTTERNGLTGLEIAGSSNFIDGCTTVSGQFGVVVEKHASRNAITRCGYDTDDTPPTREDAVDRTGACTANQWFGNFFKKRKPKCIR
jgi:Periplasmic copper-binding protein (NosD)